MSDINQNMFYVVEFPEEEIEGSCPMAIISKTWAFDHDGNKYCWWPNFKTDKARENAVKNHVPLGLENSTMCQIKIKYTTNSYEKAHKKFKLLEITSDVETDNETRKKTQPQLLKDFDLVVSENSSSSDGHLPIITLPKNLTFANTLEAERNVEIIEAKEMTESQLLTERVVEQEGQKSENCTTCKDLHKLVAEIYRNQIKCNQDFNERLDYVLLLLQKQTLYPIPGNEEVDIPITTMEELQNLEDKLLNENEYKKYLNTLKRIGGKNCVETTRRIISKIISHNLALQCNWTGRNNKPPFSSYKTVIKLIEDAVLSNPLCESTSTTAIIESTIKIWLRGACDRDGGRTHRKKNNGGE